MERSGQVTLFIILGIVLVASLAGVFLFKDYILKSEFERAASKIGVVEDFIPLYNSYGDCVEDLADEGITILASQGGYIDIPEYEYVVNPLIPFSNKLDFFNDGNFEVAYWFYETGNGIQTEKIPSLEEMQNELGDYIDENLDLCTLNFSGYEGYVINNFDYFDINVEINNYNVFVEILSDFNVDYKGVNQEFEDLKVVVDSSLGYLYSKAVETYNKQFTENYFEEKTIDYLVIYDDIPYTGESFSCSPRVWSKLNVEKDLKGIIEVNTEAVGMVNDNYYDFDLGDSSLDVNFKYVQNWPFYLDINGGEEILKEETTYGENTEAANFLNTLFCLNNFHFIYDVKYPILTTLNKNGLDFNFAFEVILDNNQPKYNELGSDLIEIDNKVCDANNIPFTLYVVDYENFETLNEVDVKFSCVGSSCDVGETSLDDFGDYSLESYVPACVNADIKTYKEGYHIGRVSMNTNEEGSGYVYMKPYHNINVIVKVLENGNVRNPYDDEEIFINFINEEDGFTQFLNGDSVNLIYGEYILRSYIMKESNQPILIKGDTVESCSTIPREGVLGFLGLKQEKCFETELEDVELETVMVGGNEFLWGYNFGSEMTIYVNYDKVPKTVTEMGNVYQNIFNSNNVRYPEVL